MPPRSLAVAVLSLCAALPGSAAAQNTSPRLEVSGSLAAGGFDGPSSTHTTPGVSAGVGIALNPRVSITGAATAFPKAELGEFETQGGRTFEARAGFRAVLFEWRRLAIESETSAGVFRFTNTFTGTDLSQGTANHFDVDLGFGLRYRLTNRLDLVAVSSGPVYAFTGRSEVLSQSAHATLTLIQPSGIAGLPQFSIGTRYRFGPPLSRSGAAAPSSRLTIGAEFSSAIAAPVVDAAPLDYPSGPGLFATYRLATHLDVDGEVATMTHSIQEASAFEGGRLTEALCGVRYGIRTPRLGAFFKVRAGVLSNSQAVAGETVVGATGTVMYERTTVPTVEAGGVLEVYAPRHVTLRLDASVMQPHFHDESTVFNGEPRPDPVLFPRSELHISTGVGWRF